MVLLLVGPEQWGTVDPSTGDTLAHWAQPATAQPQGTGMELSL
jgi:hypothetical protein